MIAAVGIGALLGLAVLVRRGRRARDLRSIAETMVARHVKETTRRGYYERI